jgi:hypothetical protein
MVSAEHDHHVGVESLDEVGGRRQSRAESVAECVLDVAFLARTVACADHQPL